MTIIATLVTVQGILNGLIATAIWAVVVGGVLFILRGKRVARVVPLTLVWIAVLGIAAWIFRASYPDLKYVVALALVSFGFIGAVFAGVALLGLLSSKEASLSNLNHIAGLVRAAVSSSSAGKDTFAEAKRVIELCDIDQGGADIVQLLEMLKTAPREAKPLLSYIARVSTYNLTSEAGEAIRMVSYLTLLQRSLRNTQLLDVTFVSMIYPSKWFDGNREQMKDYFKVQKAMTKTGVKMRRYMVGDFDQYTKDKMLTVFEDAHEKAHVDLFFLPETEFPSLRDMGVFFESDGCGWIVESDIEYGDAVSRVGPKNIEVVTVALRYGYNCMQSYKDAVIGNILKSYWRCNLDSTVWKDRTRTPELKNYPTDQFLATQGFLREPR